MGIKISGFVKVEEKNGTSIWTVSRECTHENSDEVSKQLDMEIDAIIEEAKKRGQKAYRVMSLSCRNCGGSGVIYEKVDK